MEAIAKRLNGVRGVLEIGPGPGVLTQMLTQVAEQVVAWEIDAAMPAVLAESAPAARVEQVDALKGDLLATLNAMPEPRAVVSNLPYYITGPLLTRIAEARAAYSVAVLMMQAEVARRVMAPAGHSDRGSLSVFIQVQFDVERVVNVPPGAFLPPPKVDSMVLAFRPRPLPVSESDAPKLFRLIRFAFAQPRKTLANNLLAGYHLDRTMVEGWIESAGLDARIRAQALDESAWLKLLLAMPGEAS